MQWRVRCRFETIAFSVQLTASLRICMQLLDSMFIGGPIPTAAGIVAMLLLLTQLAFVAKYWRAALTLARHPNRETAAERAADPSGAAARLRERGRERSVPLPAALAAASSASAASAASLELADVRVCTDGAGRRAGGADDQRPSAKPMLRERSSLQMPSAHALPAAEPHAPPAPAPPAPPPEHLALPPPLMRGRTLKFGSKSKSIVRLQRRLKFLIERFQPEAWYWQFVIWLRQALLTLLVVGPGIISKLVYRTPAFAAANASSAEASTSAALATAAAADGTEAAMMEGGGADGGRGSSLSSESGGGGASTGGPPLLAPEDGLPFSLVLTLGQACLALLIFVVFYTLHRLVQPFPYTFQNRLDAALFIADMLVVLLGIGYTYLHQRLITEGDVPIEALMLLILIGSLLSTLLYPVWHRWQHRRRMRCAASNEAPTDDGERRDTESDEYGEFTRSTAFSFRPQGACSNPFRQALRRNREAASAAGQRVAGSASWPPNGEHPQRLEDAAEAGVTSPSHRVPRDDHADWWPSGTPPPTATQAARAARPRDVDGAQRRGPRMSGLVSSQI